MHIYDTSLDFDGYEKLVFQYYFMHLQPQPPGAGNLKSWSALLRCQVMARWYRPQSGLDGKNVHHLQMFQIVKIS